MDFFKKLPRDLQARLIGLIVFLGTALIAYVGIMDPLIDARNHEPVISWAPETAALIPIGFILGLIFLIFGSKTEGLLNFLIRHRILGISFAVLLAVLAIAAVVVADQLFRVFGYS